MITPRRTRLVRVPDLHAFRHAIAGLSLAGDAQRLASRVVLVPTRGAALQLRRTIGSAAPALATREEFYDHLHARLDSPPARLTAYERDVMVRSAAREVSTRRSLAATARVRRRDDCASTISCGARRRTVARFEELLDEALLNDAEHDRGAERMLAQTHLLAATFRGYERRVQASGACDEHALRELLMARPSSTPIREIVVTLGDWIADPAGLYLADFDLLTRLPGLEGVDVLATRRCSNPASTSGFTSGCRASRSVKPPISVSARSPPLPGRHWRYLAPIPIGSCSSGAIARKS